jgi:hypothetical protein
VLKAGQVIAEVINPATGQPPTVQILEPTPNSSWPIGTQQTIRWDAVSPSGAPLVALVQYSPDGGKTRFTLGRDVSGDDLTVNPDELPGGPQAMVYVQVSDGMNMAEAEAGPFNTESKPPFVRIVAPQANAKIVAGLPVSLEGSASDREEELADQNFTWSSSRDGVLGSGKVFLVPGLSEGEHTLTLTITDSQGLVAEDNVVVVVAGSTDSTSTPQATSLGGRIGAARSLLALVASGGIVTVIIQRRRR